MLLNSYLWKKGLKDNERSYNINDLSSIIPKTSLNEISHIQNKLMDQNKVKNIIKKIEIKKSKDNIIHGGTNNFINDIKMKEEEHNNKKKIQIYDQDKKEINLEEGGFMELNEEIDYSEESPEKIEELFDDNNEFMDINEINYPYDDIDPIDNFKLKEEEDKKDIKDVIVTRFN